MTWSRQLFNYCERGLDPSFWAEPFNAVSNVAFIVAAGAAAIFARRHRRSNAIEWMLIALVAAIGIGSFLFHTFATRWAAVADTAPIGVFMIAYMIFALRRFLSAPWLAVIAGVTLFIFSFRTMSAATCDLSWMPITAGAGRACLNGSLAYGPALVALAILATGVLITRHPAARWISAATAALAISLAFRAFDFEVCGWTEVFGSVRGTHPLWHLTNAFVLYFLLRAALLPTETRPT